jgi:hypothetical protein
VRSASTFRPTALLATRGTTTSCQGCSEAGRARAGGRARTFLSAARVGAAHALLQEKSASLRSWMHHAAHSA